MHTIKVVVVVDVQFYKHNFNLFYNIDVPGYGADSEFGISN
jgi:hypothetical protein